MKIVALVPSRINIKKKPPRDIRELGGVPLVNYTMKALNGIHSIDDIFIFASEPTVTSYVGKGLKYRYLKRPANLDEDDATIQEIISEFLSQIDAEIVVLWHITSPFLRAETIRECIEKVASGEHDSAFTAFKVNKFCWYDGQPLNYGLGGPTPRTKDLKPVIIEQSALYVFTKEVFLIDGRRIGKAPYIKFIDHLEGHDINTEDDFAIAEMIVRANLFPLY